MAQYIDKSALVAEIEKCSKKNIHVIIQSRQQGIIAHCMNCKITSTPLK